MNLCTYAKKKNDEIVYIIHRADDPTELRHYGIKGMKWGVRRSKSDKYFNKANKIIVEAEKKSDIYGKKADKTISKQQKLQAKRFSTMNKLQQQGKNDKASKYYKMTEKEKKIYKKTY